MSELKFLDSYKGQSLDELLAMEATYRVDSLLLAIESALDQKMARKGDSSLSPEERVVLVIEALEREVNNGGYHQFFFNSRGYAGEVETALRAIDCPGQAELARRAIETLGIDGAIHADSVEAAIEAGGDELLDALSSLDNEYYACIEPIEARLFAFVRANRKSIRL